MPLVQEAIARVAGPVLPQLSSGRWLRGKQTRWPVRRPVRRANPLCAAKRQSEACPRRGTSCSRLARDQDGGLFGGRTANERERNSGESVSRDRGGIATLLVRSAGILDEKNGDRGALQDYCDAEPGGGGLFCRET